MCNSFIQAAERFDFELRIGCPPAYAPSAERVAEGGGRARVFADPREAVEGVDLVVTDVWASMGQEDEQQARLADFTPFQVNADLLAGARPDALIMHCLPAHRGEEITAAVIDGPRSVVWDEAENRLHAQKALLEFLLPV
jgi:ornithine carbamoyltransferase